MAEKEPSKPQNRRKDALYVGLWVFIMLGVLTFGEYLVGVIAPPWGNLLLLVALFKAFWVIKDYMHVGRAFGPDEEESH
jgi:hypothetical protein